MIATQPQYSLTALAVGAFHQDQPLLQKIFRDLGWRLFEAPDRRRALGFLARHSVQVVIAESDLPNWDWKDVLADLRGLASPPQLIVASRLADDHLWSEVLNIGGYDVLPQPLVRDEVERVVASARRHHRIEPARATAGTAVASNVA